MQSAHTPFVPLLFWLLAVASPVLADGVDERASAVLESRLKADRVVVRKSERRLYLYLGENVVASYPVALGQHPKGHKREQGDSRTPEGRYVLDWRNLDSDFFLSIHVSYPNAQDLYAARHRGVKPGGGIMIHGQPNEAPGIGKLAKDWTDGCIAVSNAAMLDIWLAIDGDETPIEIYP